MIDPRDAWLPWGNPSSDSPAVGGLLFFQSFRIERTSRQVGTRPSWRDLILLIALLSTSLGTLPSLAFVDDSPTANLPLDPVEDFVLPDAEGKEFTLSGFGQRVVVLAFLGTECPLAKLYAPKLNALANRYRSRGVEFVGIDSNSQDSLAEIAHYVRLHQIHFPVLKDTGNVVADRLAAERTPEIFVLDAARRVRYRGRIDDQYGIGVFRNAATKQELSDAIEDLLADRPVRQPRTTAVGCIIGRTKQPKGDATVTWSGEIAKIFQTHCQSCHRPGEIGPFSLVNHEDTVGWGDMIREVVEQERMPPWHADPRYGEFANNTRLTDEEKQLIIQWVKEGGPEGDKAQLLPPRAFPSGWQIPEPDQVFPMSDKPFLVPAEGVIEYVYYTVDPKFTEGKWIQAVECRPGNPSVVHHINVFVLMPEMADTYDRDDLTNHLIQGYAPGFRTVPFPPGMAYYVPAGAKFVFQMHYTANGREQEDLSYMGVTFAKPDEVRTKIVTTLCLNVTFQIPPKVPDYRVDAIYEFTDNAMLHSLIPHMHLRGKTFKYELFYPDGSHEILLDVPRFDFYLQNSYVLSRPKPVPKGAMLRCVAHFDNSEDNLGNPDPNATVVWGDQTNNEMMIGYVLMGVDKDWKIPPVPRARKDSTTTREESPAWLPIAWIGGLSLAMASIGIWIRRARRNGPDAKARRETERARGESSIS
ncbi:MAG: redoxin domain-containing protein [Planctomycetota bacterium]